MTDAAQQLKKRRNKGTTTRRHGDATATATTSSINGAANEGNSVPSSSSSSSSTTATGTPSTSSPRSETASSGSERSFDNKRPQQKRRKGKRQTEASSLTITNFMSSILPTRAGYKRVDNVGGAQENGRMRFGWKKFVIGAVVVIGLVWVFGPRERRESVLGTVAPSWKKPTRPEKPETVYDDGDSLMPVASPTHTPTTGDKNTNQPARPQNAPSSPESDPDPSKTVYCTQPFSSDARLVQYALMIDAGSTGSRIHIYKFNNCGSSPTYEYEVFRQTQPGLSAYASDPTGAARSLDVLLDEAVRVIPEELRACTPVAVKATAGLRLLGARESEGILDAVKRRLAEMYPFSVVEKDGVVIMDGKDEGVYAWITANYLLGAIGGGASTKDTQSFAVLDLGGASTQIVFEPRFDEPDSKFVDGEHKYELQFGGSTYVLYQHSYLGYGLMRARQSVHRLVEFMATFNQGPAAMPEMNSFMGEVANPCLARGTRRMVKIDPVLPGELAREVNMVGGDVGSFEGCNRVVELVMAKDAICQVKPCSFNGVYQPSILETFSKGNILLLSYFYDRIAPFYASLMTTEQPRLNISSIASLAQEVCQGRAAWESSSWGSDRGLIAELEDRPEWCLDLTFMHALLRLGYEFGEERTVRIEKQVDGTELGWCLGATIAIVGGELTCRI